MPEPDWKNALDDWAAEHVRGSHAEMEAAWSALLPHIEAAYQRGLMAGRSQAGYRKNKNGGGVCPTCLSATGADESSASAGEP